MISEALLREDEADHFCWLLDRAMPWAGGLAIVLETYFDASERPGGTFCVAGFAFGADRAKKASGAWRRLWGETRCHMTDLHSRPQQSYGWSSAEAGEMLQKSVPIICAHASFGVAVSCRVADIQRLAPTYADPGSVDILGGYRTAYAICAHAAMASLAMVIQSDAAYFFESGDVGQGESQRFMKMIATYPVAARQLYRMRSHSVLSKADCRIMEMADIFAWEWAKHVERDAEGKAMRGSLAALMGQGLIKKGETNMQSPTHRGWHMSGEHLERFYRKSIECGFFSDDPSPEQRAKLHATASRFWAE